MKAIPKCGLFLENLATELTQYSRKPTNIFVISYTRRNVTGEKHSSCDQCPQSFSASNDIKKHRGTDTGEKQISPEN